jgi:hypothetical protein
MEKQEKRKRKSKKGHVWEITYKLVKEAPRKKGAAKTAKKAKAKKAKTKKAKAKK